MYCQMCEAKMGKKVADYQYTDCGLQNVLLKKIEVLICTKCDEEEILIPHIEQLHQLIAKVVASQRHRLLPQEIRFLRSHLGWSGIDFSKAIDVTPETVSRWETGKSQMSLSLERFLRLLVISQSGPFREYKHDLLQYGSAKHSRASRRVFVAKKSEWREAA